MGCNTTPEYREDPRVFSDLRGAIRPNKAKYEVGEDIIVEYFLTNVSGEPYSVRVIDGSNQLKQPFESYAFNALLQEGDTPLKLVQAGEPFKGELALKDQEKQLFVKNIFQATKPGKYLLSFSLRWQEGKKVVFKPLTIFVLESEKQLESSPDFDALLEKLTATDPQEREAAREEVKSHGKEITPALVELMGSKDNRLKSEAMFILVSMGNKAIDALVTGSRHRNSEIRMRSIYALGQIGSEEAVTVAKRALEEDIDKDVRLTAFRLVAENFVDKIAIPLMIQTLDDPNLEIREEVIKVLEKRTGQRFNYNPEHEPKEREAAIIRWKKWWNERQPGTFDVY